MSLAELTLAYSLTSGATSLPPLISHPVCTGFNAIAVRPLCKNARRSEAVTNVFPTSVFTAVTKNFNLAPLKPIIAEIK